MSQILTTYTVGILLTGAVVWAVFHERPPEEPIFKTNKPGTVVIKVPGMA
jgi:hypothetical protein